MSDCMQTDKTTIGAIILAGGQGQRMQSKVPKQYIMFREKPLLYYTIKAFEDCNQIQDIVIVCGKNEMDYCRKEIVSANGFKKVVAVVEGGAERYHSVHNGLKALSHVSYVLIHDGARPLVSQKIIKDSIEAVKIYDACICAVPTKDTIKVVDSDGFVKETPNRKTLWNVQTPQTFRYDLIKKAYDKIMTENDTSITDDAMVLEKAFGTKIKVVMGDYSNIKITTPEDMKVLQGLVDNS